MKFSKRLLSILIICFLLFSMLPFHALAEGESGVRLLGTELVPGVYYRFSDPVLEMYPQDSIPADSDSFAVLTPDGTLTLHNFKGRITVSGEAAANGLSFSAGSDSLMIRLEGENEIISDGCYSVLSGDLMNRFSHGIHADGKELIFCGAGSLKVTSSALENNSDGFTESVAVTAKKIILNDSARLEAVSGFAANSIGIKADSILLSGENSRICADGLTAAMSVYPVSGSDGFFLSVSSGLNPGLTGAGYAEVCLSAPVHDPLMEPVPEQAVPYTEPYQEPVTEQAVPYTETYQEPVIEQTIPYTETYQEPVIEQPSPFFEAPAQVPASQEPEVQKLPGVMPEESLCYCTPSCTTPDNNDGYIVLPEGQAYEWRYGTEGDFIPMEYNGISGLVPGVYQIRLCETENQLPSEPRDYIISAYEPPAVLQIIQPEISDPPQAETVTGGPQTEIAEVQAVPQAENDSVMQIGVSVPAAVEELPEVSSVVVASGRPEKVKIGAEFEVDTGEGLKAADTLFPLMTMSGPFGGGNTSPDPSPSPDPGSSPDPDPAPSPTPSPAPKPAEISFVAESSNSGYLTGSGLRDGLKYRIGDTGDYTNEIKDISSNQFPISGLAGACTLYIIDPGDLTADPPTLPSEPLLVEVGKYAPPTASEVYGKDATAYSPDKGSMYFDKAGRYAYRVKGSGETFNVLTGVDPDQPLTFGVPAETYEVRTQCRDNNLASEIVYITVRAYLAPDVHFDADSECSGYLTGVDTAMEYRINDGAWYKIGAGSNSIYFPNVTEGTTITVCYPDTGAATDLVISRQETPDEKIVSVTDCTTASNNDGTIVLNTADYSNYEIRFGTSGSFTQLSASKITGLTNGTYQLRTRASGLKLASKLCNVIVNEYIPPKGIECQSISIQPYEKIFDTTDGYSTLTVTFYPYNTTNQTVTFTSSNENIVNFGTQSRTVIGTDGRATIRIYPTGSGEATITATTANGKTAVCRTTVSFEYRFTYNKSGTWYYDRGGDYTVQTNGPMSRFSALKINGNTVNPQYYSTRANSDGTTILTISQYAMKSLNHGAYQKLQLVYNDGGVATTYLHILSVNDRPITGDSGNAALWTMVSFSSLLALAAVTVLKRRPE